MSRTFTPVDLVQLPRIDSNSAVALASAVESAASSFHDLPASLTETLTQIGQDKRLLLAALAKTPGGALTIKEADRRVDKVGGALHDIGEILTLLKLVHAEYGATIGTTQTLEEAPEIRDSKDLLLDSLRTYVLQVAGTVKRGKPETATRADALLAPVRAWESTKAAKEKADPSAPAGGSAGSSNAPSTGTTGG